METLSTSPEARKGDLTFNEALQQKAEALANELDEKAKNTRNRDERNELIRKSDSYHEAIGEIKGMTKAEAVEWIQENAGGKKSAEMADAGQHKGEVWSRQTACDVLSSWKSIFKAVASIIYKNSQEE